MCVKSRVLHNFPEVVPLTLVELAANLLKGRPDDFYSGSSGRKVRSRASAECLFVRVSLPSARVRNTRQ
jgi:hypothetical protein